MANIFGVISEKVKSMYLVNKRNGYIKARLYKWFRCMSHKHSDKKHQHRNVTTDTRTTRANRKMVQMGDTHALIVIARTFGCNQPDATLQTDRPRRSRPRATTPHKDRYVPTLRLRNPLFTVTSSATNAFRLVMGS